ncbi:hypothetical protein BG004_005096 [Podila humilis]|nr:hypothetical protein BG004_005096 [Podila humilis]
MDQEIVQFLAFLEQCRQQSRLESIKDMFLCFDDLQDLLDRIDRTLSRIDNLPEEPSHLYPSLGSLLEHLCRNPVLLTASDILSHRVTLLVLKYSETPAADKRISELNEKDRGMAQWCSNRMDDLLLLRQKSQPLFVQDAFMDIFGVSAVDLQEQQILESLQIMTESLIQLERRSMATTPYSRALIKWTVDLSYFLSAILHDPRIVPLTSRMISTAHVLLTQLTPARMLKDDQLLSSNFIERIVSHEQDQESEQPGALSDLDMRRLWLISVSARKKSFLRLLDTVIQSSAAQPDFFHSRKELSGLFLDESRLFRMTIRSNTPPAPAPAVAPAPLEMLGAYLEDMASWLSEIPDWRLMRIGITVTSWMLSQERCLNQQQEGHGAEWIDSAAPLKELLISAASLVNQGPKSMQQIPVQALEAFSQAHWHYVYAGGDSARLSTRRSLVIILAMAIAQTNEFLMHCIRIHLNDLKKENESGPIALAGNSPFLLFVARLFLANCNLDQLQSFAEHISHCIKDLLIVCSLESDVNKMMDNTAKISRNLKVTLARYKDALWLNTTVVADLACAMWLHLNMGEASGMTTFHPLIEGFAQTLYPLTVDGSSPPGLASSPFIVRLRDIYDSCVLSGLDVALAPFLE